MERNFLPISRQDMKRRGWEQCDFVYVIGDAIKPGQSSDAMHQGFELAYNL